MKLKPAGFGGGDIVQSVVTLNHLGEINILIVTHPVTELPVYVKRALSILDTEVLFLIF